jgi:hypothetical protein
VAKQTSKGSRHQRRASAIERKATQHHDFVGDADPERAEAEFRKRERLQEEENHDVVREMAAELESAAGLQGGAAGSPLRIPRSVDEARDLMRDAPLALREKARERLGRLPEPALQLLHVAEAAAGVLLLPVRIGFRVFSEVAKLPLSVIRSLRQREA